MAEATLRQERRKITVSVVSVVLSILVTVTTSLVGTALVVGRHNGETARTLEQTTAALKEVVSELRMLRGSDSVMLRQILITSMRLDYDEAALRRAGIPAYTPPAGRQQ